LENVAPRVGAGGYQGGEEEHADDDGLALDRVALEDPEAGAAARALTAARATGAEPEQPEDEHAKDPDDNDGEKEPSDTHAVATARVIVITPEMVVAVKFLDQRVSSELSGGIRGVGRRGIVVG